MNRRYRDAVGMTLMELIVVIAIILILAALVTPVYRSVVRRSQSSQCIHNLKQLAVAFQRFANDHEMRLPSADDTGGHMPDPDNPAPDSILSYLGGVPLGDHVCPTAAQNYTDGAPIMRMYGQNTGGEFDPFHDKTVQWKLMLVENPSKKMFYTCMPEAVPGWSNPYFFWTGTQLTPLPYWHGNNDTSHVLMLDWHVQPFLRNAHTSITKSQVVFSEP